MMELKMDLNIEKTALKFVGVVEEEFSPKSK